MYCSPSVKTRICYQFEAFCKQVIHNARCDYFRQLYRRTRRETLFSELPAAVLAGLGAAGGSIVDVFVFELFGYQIPICNDSLAAALLDLGTKAYCVLLLSYCLELSDREIGQMLGYPRSSIQRMRTKLLSELKEKMMKE